MTAWQRLISSWRTNSHPQAAFAVIRKQQSISLAPFPQAARHLSGRRAIRRGDLFFCASLAFPSRFSAYSRINFCPMSPKPMNSYNSLIIMDITYYLPIKSPKIHWKPLLLYINFANFLSSPFSKLPNPNDVVSSINAYGVNNWHLVSYNGGKRAAMQCKNAIKCLISSIYYIFFVLCAPIGI